MAELIAVVEGHSELRVTHGLLAPHFAARGMWMRAILVGKPGHEGGAKRWQAVKGEICKHLKSGAGRRAVYVTTMFDYYGMPLDWPGRAEAKAKSALGRGSHVQGEMHKTVCTELGSGFDPSLFLPYVQMHELEALLYVEPLQLKVDYAERHREVHALAGSVQGMKPEEINDSVDSAPSKRIIHHVPEYEGDKALVVSAVLQRIGLPALRASCPHFAEWLTRLESITPPSPTTHT